MAFTNERQPVKLLPRECEYDIDEVVDIAKRTFNDPLGKMPETLVLSYMIGAGGRLWPHVLPRAPIELSLTTVLDDDNPANPHIAVDGVGAGVFESIRHRFPSLNLAAFFIEERKKWETHDYMGITDPQNTFMAVLDPCDGTNLFGRRVQARLSGGTEEDNPVFLTQASGLTLYDIDWNPVVSGIISLVDHSCLLASTRQPQVSGLYDYNVSSHKLTIKHLPLTKPQWQIATLPRHKASYDKTCKLFDERLVYQSFGGQALIRFVKGEIEMGLADTDLGRMDQGEYKSGQPPYELANWGAMAKMLGYSFSIYQFNQEISLQEMMEKFFIQGTTMPRLRVLISRNPKTHQELQTAYNL